MKVSQDSWMYKVAYGANRYKPDQGNLCGFFWKFVFMLFVGWPVVGTFLAVMYMLGFLIGHRPPPVAEFVVGREPVPYQKWPNIKGVRILPIYAIFLGVCLCIPLGLWMKVGIAVGSAIVLTGLVIGICYLLNSETADVIGEYIAAKKAKVCPLITFTKDKQK